MLVLAAFFTAYYSGRLLMLVFYSEPRGPKLFYEHAHEPARHMTVPLLALYVSTLFFGFYFRDMLIGHGTEFWQGSLCVSERYVNAIYLSEITIGGFLRNIPLFLSVLGLILSYFVFNGDNFFSLNHLRTIVLSHRFFSKKWYFDSIYNTFFAFPAYRFFYSVPFKSIDKGVLEHAGPYGLVTILQKIASEIKQVGTGYVFDYLIFIVIGFGLLLAFSFYRSLLFSDSFTESFCLVVVSVFTIPLFLHVQATKPPEYL
jgi:NADH:ubiquinone oxidoreductase subunit 5 (subunit L)/multisubunit Na+/H+ antiporter MnhA subunit